MKLNPDCVRDVLLEVEERTDFCDRMMYYIEDPKPKRWEKYDHSEIIYHVRQCEYSGLILGAEYLDGGDCIFIDDLSPSGHKFLANVRQDTIWNHTKEIAGKIGTKSLDALLQISTSVITELIRAQCGII